MLCIMFYGVHSLHIHSSQHLLITSLFCFQDSTPNARVCDGVFTSSPQYSIFMSIEFIALLVLTIIAIIAQPQVRSCSCIARPYLRCLPASLSRWFYLHQVFLFFNQVEKKIEESFGNMTSLYNTDEVFRRELDKLQQEVMRLVINPKDKFKMLS